MYEQGIRDARRHARALLHRCGVRAPEHICVERFAKRLGAKIIEAPLDGAQSQLVRNGDDIHILVAERIKDECARRFSIAHELGHLDLAHPSCTPRELGQPLKRGKQDRRSYEGEANTFSGETLMPEALVRTICEVSPMSLDVPWRIARDYRVSILAGAIRCAELASERCAAVFSVRGAVKWVATSATFTHEIARGTRLDPQSVAADFFAKGAIDDRAQPVPASAWLRTCADAEIIEHSIASAQHGTTLTMLWIPESSSYELDRAI